MLALRFAGVRRRVGWWISVAPASEEAVLTGEWREQLTANSRTPGVTTLETGTSLLTVCAKC